MIVIAVDILIVAFLLAADLVTKHYAAKLLASGGPYEAIPKVLTFRYTENTGAAFGMLSDSRILLSVFVGIVVLGMIGFLVYHIIKKKYKEKGGILLHVSLSFVIAGGIGNLVDRIALGYVRDFIDYTVLYTLFKLDFAICNLADVFLTIGVILLIVYMIIYMVNDSKNRKQTAAEQPLPDEGAEPLTSDLPDATTNEDAESEDAIISTEDSGEEK